MIPLKTTCTKQYRNLPAAHRQPAHDGHCRFLHGHNYNFDITFGTYVREPGTNFVIDFGKLDEVKKLLEHQFDHTFLVVETDPCYDDMAALSEKKLIDMRVMKDTSAEGMAEWVFTHVNNRVQEITSKRVFVTKVVCWEDDKNYATAEG